MEGPWGLRSGENKKVGEVEEVKVYRGEDEDYEGDRMDVAV